MEAERKKLEEILSNERLEALQKTLNILVKAKNLGLLNTINDILEPEILGGLIKIVMSPCMLRLVDRLDEIMEILAKVDYESVKENVELVNIAIKSMPKKVEPVGLIGFMRALRDPDVQKGLGFIVEFLRNLGKNLK